MAKKQIKKAGRTVAKKTVAAVKKAFTDVGREVPDEFRSRTVGARDVVE